MYRAIIFVLLSAAIWVVDSTSPIYPTTPEGVCMKPPTPKTCADPNEVYNECGGCDGTCDNPDPICNKMCHVGCFCKPGMVRDRSGKCILKRNCPPTTPVCIGPNEEYSECGSCDPTCDNLNPICIAACIKGCFCKKGFVRDGSGNCILQRNCPVTTPPIVCGKNEVPTNCLPSQQPSCKNRRCVKAKVCVPGCVCAPGYVRCSMCGCGTCVKIEDCHEPYI